MRTKFGVFGAMFSLTTLTSGNLDRARLEAMGRSRSASRFTAP